MRKSEVEPVREITNWNPPFTFTFVFHHRLETTGHIPTWPELTRWLNRDEQGRLMLGAEIQREHQRLDRTYGERLVEDCLQWRLGNAYYSFLRELHVLTRLRDAGLDAQVHPLADALFCVDAWVDNRILCLYVGNDAYRNGHAGRKREAETILAGAPRPFRFESLNLPVAAEYGKVHLPRPEVLEDQIAQLRGSAPHR